MTKTLTDEEYKELVRKSDQLEELNDFCELLLKGEEQEWERVVKRGNKKEMADWLNEKRNEKIIRLEKQLDIAFKILHKFAFDYDDTTKPSVFIENSLIALGDMREVK